MIRLVVIVKFVRAEIKRLLHPKAVIPVQVGQTVIPKEIVTNVIGFLVLMIGLFVAGVILMSVLGLDLESSLRAVAATVGNIGPGLGGVGPTDNYAHIPGIGK